MIAGLIAQTPLGRMGKSDEIAAAALFSSFMTGSELFADGGYAQV
jgi:NAD(P)-dependent dehydrogenase (short-subunit alcohol dehydrogenase family)